MKYAVVYAKTDNGYSAHIPDLPGCIAAGETLEQTRELIREAAELHLQGMREDGDPVPEPTTLADYVVVQQDIAAG